MSNVDNTAELSDKDIIKGKGLVKKNSDTKEFKTKWKKKPKLAELKQDLDEAKGSQSAFIANLDRWNTLYLSLIHISEPTRPY